MKKSLLEKYYDGILSQLQGEVEFINELFSHNGLKGEGNESAIREMIKRFIPKNFSVGTGIVIDRLGNNSRQCDIIIYDSYYYPEILSLSSVHLFPVDFVYATIEIKTTLDSKSSKEAIENIISVKELDYIKHLFRINPTESVTRLDLDTVLFETKSTDTPFGLVFGFRSTAKNFSTFTNWFKPKEEEKEKLESWPSHIFCLDQGIIIHPTTVKKRFDLIAPVREEYLVGLDAESSVFEANGKKWVMINNTKYPVTSLRNGPMPIDQTKVLLNFITILDGILKRKLLSPNINFRDEYLSNELRSLYNMNEEYESGE